MAAPAIAPCGSISSISPSIALKRDYGNLGVYFDLWKGEACVNDLIPPMVEDMKKKGIAVEDKGALIVPVKEETDKQDIPPLILIKSDGAAMYGTTDLATIVDRVNCQNPDRSASTWSITARACISCRCSAPR